MQDNNFRRAQLAHERAAESAYEDACARSYALEAYKEDNEIDAFVTMLDSFKGNEGVEICAILQESDSRQKDALKVHQYLRQHFARGKLNGPEYSELGKAFAAWFYDSAYSIVNA